MHSPSTITVTQQHPRWDFITPQSAAPPARSGHCAAVHDGKIYIFGGADADYFYNDIWSFDPRTNVWTPIPASGYLPTGRHGHSCSMVDGIFYVFGGNGPDGTDMNDAYAFRIHERRWYLFQNVGTIPSPRNGHNMCTIKDKLFMIGGDSEKGLMEDPAMVYYLDIPRIRFPDSPQAVPPRQASQQASSDAPADADSQQGPGRPDRPTRPDRNMGQRPGTMQQQQQTPGAPSESPSLSNRSLAPESSPPTSRNKVTNIVSPAAPTNNRREDEINPFASLEPVSSSGPYVLPPGSSGARQNQKSVTPSPPTSGQITVPTTNANRSPSPAAMRAQNRANAEQSSEMAKQIEQLQKQMREREEELTQMRKRENWLVTEVVLARQLNGAGGEQQLDAQQRAQLRQQLTLAKALLKMSIATQAQAASLKIKEAERIRTGALQEAAYLKAKLSSMTNANQDPDALARVETERAMDLEKRLTLALSEMELLESQFSKTQETLQQEKLARLSAEERSNGASLLADQAQAAHTRALAELSTLHGRATKAEEEAREFATHSLKVLHKNSQTSASKSASELADAMIEISRLEQSSMKAQAESISLQRQLAEERKVNGELRSELSKTEQDLENKAKELENNEVQLGLLKDVMREK
ncbi:MAG: hypothetical protein J3Q66DRAFT_277990, partial [Benniella sp.]